MKKRIMRRFKIIFFLLIFGLSVFSGGYYYLDKELNKISVSDNVSSVPYYSSTPSNSTVLMQFCEDIVILDLDFNQKILNVTFVDENDTDYGYNADYRVKTDYNQVGYWVDLVGGIELADLRYTGVQIIEKLEYSNIADFEKQEIAEKIIEGISKSGFSKEDLLYIIENSDTDLKFNETFVWVDLIPELCKFPRFIN